MCQVSSVCVMRRLQQHGNAVKLKGVYEDDHNVYIVMEECRGGDLEQLMDVRTSLSFSMLKIVCSTAFACTDALYFRFIMCSCMNRAVCARH